MPFERTAATAGDHIDWMTTSPDAIRLTLSSKLFQKARNWPSCLALIRKSIVLSISSLVMLPLSAYLMLPIASMIIAASMMPIDGMLRIDGLALEGRVHDVGPGGDLAADEVGADAERVGVVDGRHHRHPAGRLLGEGLGVRRLDEADRVRRGALRDDAVRRQLAG